MSDPKDNNKETDPKVPPAAVPPKAEADDKFVPRDVYEKLMIEKKNWADKAKAMEAKLEEENLTKMKEKDDQKGLNELLNKKVSELNDQLKKREEEDERKVKYAKVKQEWQKLGLNDDNTAEKLFNMVNLNSIKIDKELNVVLGHEDEAKRIYEDWKPVFGAAATAKANHAAPMSKPIVATVEEYNRLLKSGEWRKLSKAEQHAFVAKIYEAHGVIAKSKLI